MTNFIGYLNRLIRTNPFPSALITIFIILCVFFNISLASIIISLIIVYRELPGFLDSNIFDSKLFRFALAPFFYVTLLQCVILVSWVIDKNFPLNLTSVLTLVLIICAYIYSIYVSKARGERGMKSVVRSPWINLPDIISVLVGVAMLGIVVVAPLVTYGIHQRSSVLGLINGGVDDSSHLSMFNDRLQFNRGILYESSAAENIRSNGSTIYPAGWHSANAAIVKSLYPNIKTGDQSLQAYIITKVFWFSLLLFTFTKTIFLLYKKLSREKGLPLAATVWLGFGSMLFSYFFFLGTFSEGFYNFLPQLLVVLLLALALIQLHDTKNDSAVSFQKSTLIVAILCMGGALPWLLILPALLLAILLSLIDRVRQITLPNFIKEFLAGVVTHLPFYALLALAIAVQVYVSMSSKGASTTFIGSLLIPGGIVVYIDQFYTFIFVGMALCLVLFEKISSSTMKALFNLMAPILVFVGFINIVQWYYSGINNYYYYKVLDTFTVIAIPIAIVGFGLLIDWVGRNKSKALTLPLASLFILLALQLIGLNPGNMAFVTYAKGIRSSSPMVNESIYKELQGDATQANYDNKNYVFYYEPGNMVQNYFSTMILRSNKPDSACFNTSLPSLFTETGFSSVQSAIEGACANGYTITLVTDSMHATAFKTIIGNSKTQSIIRVLSYQDTFNN